MNRIAVGCMIGALLIGSFHFPQYGLARSAAVWTWAYVLPLTGLMIFSLLKSKAWQPLLLGSVGGWFVASVMVEQWLAPFPQMHWLRSFGIDTASIALHLFSIFALLGATQLTDGPLKKGLTILLFLGILAYWFLPQQFLFENIKALTEDARETLIYQNGELSSAHWRREVFTDPPWKEFPSVAYNEYGLAAIGHGMGMQMDPANEGRRAMLYTVQLYGSIAVIYLRVAAVISSFALLISIVTNRFKKFADPFFRFSVALCYVLPPLLNLLLCLAAIGFAEAEGEIGRYIWINLSLSLAAIAVFIQHGPQKERT